MKATIVFFLISLIAAAAAACSQPESTFPPNLAPETDFSFFQSDVTPTAPSAPTPTPTLTPTPVSPPTASFAIDVSNGSAPLTVRFSNLSQGPATSWEWDFGDGTTRTEQNPSHRYTLAGTYTAQLKVTGPGGTDTTQMADLITVRPGPPFSLEVSPSEATLAVEEGTQFTAVALDEFGNEVLLAATPEWVVVAGGSSIDAAGRFTADTRAGSFPDSVMASLQTAARELEAKVSVTVVPGPVANVLVRPGKADLGIGNTQVFTVEVLDEFENQITDALISFNSTPDVGTIDGDGSFIAGTQAGNFPGAVQVEAVKDTARASTTSDVSIEPGPLASIKVDPSPLLLRRGDSVELTATGYDRHGNAIPELEFAWEADPGLAVDQTGRVTTAPAIPGPGLVSWWPGEGHTNDVAGDNHGVTRGGASFAPGVVGQGFNLDGINDYILVDDSDDLDITGDVTVHLWAQRTQFFGAQVMVAKGGGVVGGVDVPTVFSLRFVRPGDPRFPGDHLRVVFQRANGFDVNLIGPAVTNTFFHHYAYVRVGITHKLFLDGVLIPHQLYLESKLVSTDTFPGYPGSTQGLRMVIGAFRTDADPSGFRVHFGGIIDEVQVFNRGLSDAEIMGVYEATKPNAQLTVTVRATYKNDQQAAVVTVAVGN